MLVVVNCVANGGTSIRAAYYFERIEVAVDAVPQVD